jgi:hypothetical protein
MDFSKSNNLKRRRGTRRLGKRRKGGRKLWDKKPPRATIGAKSNLTCFFYSYNFIRQRRRRRRR